VGTLATNPLYRVVLPKPERTEAKVLDEQGPGQFLDAIRGTTLFPLLVTAVSTVAVGANSSPLEW
jgi:hypothetical protein